MNTNLGGEAYANFCWRLQNLDQRHILFCGRTPEIAWLGIFVDFGDLPLDGLVTKGVNSDRDRQAFADEINPRFVDLGTNLHQLWIGQSHNHLTFSNGHTGLNDKFAAATTACHIGIDDLPRLRCDDLALVQLVFDLLQVVQFFLMAILFVLPSHFCRSDVTFELGQHLSLCEFFQHVELLAGEIEFILRGIHTEFLAFQLQRRQQTTRNQTLD